MQHTRNNYQLSKTIRFALVPKKKKSLKGKDVFRSHRLLDELVQISVNRIKDELPKNAARVNLLQQIEEVIFEIDVFLKDWEWILNRNGMLTIEKDYYRILCKKIGLNGFWGKGRNRKPQSRNISLFELDEEPTKSLKENILRFWKKVLLAVQEKLFLAKEKSEEFKQAEEISRSDCKPNEVELRKAILSLLKITSEILEPLYNRQIAFPKVGTLDFKKDDNQKWKKIVEGERFEKLYGNIRKLRTYFEENGGYVPYCRATLNPKTMVKSSLSSEMDVSPEIKKLGLEKLLEQYKTSVEFNSYLEHLSVDEKLKRMADANVELFERSLLFKYSPIPATVLSECAKKLSAITKVSELSARDFLHDIGVRRSPAKDYCDNKIAFDIGHYPLKDAFDFSWEGLAKIKFHPQMEFPKEACKDCLLKFGVDSGSDKNFLRYANLLELETILTELDRNMVGEKKLFLDRGKKIVGEIDWGKDGGDKSKNSILNRIESDRITDDYTIAKRKLSIERGRLKSNVRRYKQLTNTYKSVSMESGQIFAAMRDKIFDIMDLNRISHYAMIAEDSNKDRYILLQKANPNSSELIYSKCKPNCGSGDFKMYFVNSITSRAIAKMLKKRHIEKLRNGRNTPANCSSTGQRSNSEIENERFNELKKFIQDKQWDREFSLNMNFQNREDLGKEIDSKCYEFCERFLNKKGLNDLVKEKGCLLLPIINQDLAKEKKGDGNQFTKDWNAAFSRGTPWRLTPEFRISYRHPTPEYPTSEIGDKRYSRFSMTAYFLCDYIPKGKFISLREQIENFRDEEKQKEKVQKFNDDVNGKTEEEKVQDGISALTLKWGSSKISKKKKDVVDKKREKFSVFGIDRGQKELATLCVINQDKEIQGPFKIYTRTFNTGTKEWNHKFLEERYILDLSNLRVETTLVIDGVPKKEKVLVDLSEVLVKDSNGDYVKPKKLQIRLHQAAYIRKLQFKMQNDPKRVLKWFEENSTDERIYQNFVDKENGEPGLVSFLGVAVEELKNTLPIEKIRKMLASFKDLSERESRGEDVKIFKKQLIELDPVDGIKSGVVANMVGVIAFLLSKYDYNAYISLEDLSKPFEKSISGLSGMRLSGASGKASDVEKYAGIGLYNFFEMQLLKKLFRIQQASDKILHLVPAFRAVKNYELNIAGGDKVKNQFGIVFFVDADGTSIKCPRCGAFNDMENKKKEKESILLKYPDAKKGRNPATGKDCWIYRDKRNGNDRVHCYVCGFDTAEENAGNPFEFIKSGDDNAAYIISAEAIKAYDLAKTVVENRNGGKNQ